MLKISDFELEYFIQTRKEIDTEKRERDQMLNFVLLILGAIGFGVTQSETAQEFLQETDALFVELPVLFIISTLFWVRYKKLRQIADRWFVLHRIALHCFGKERVAEMLEGIVYKDLTKWRYIRKDFVLNIAFCLPIYGLILIPLFNLYSGVRILRIISLILIVVLHFVVSSIILGRKIKDPLTHLPIKEISTDKN